MTAGTTYQIAADGYDGAFGRVKFARSFVPPGSATSTVTATHTPDPSPVGTASAINVTAAGGSGAPTGVVVVKEGETVVGTGTLSGGAASVPLPAGTTADTHST